MLVQHSTLDPIAMTREGERGAGRRELGDLPRSTAKSAIGGGALR